MHGLTRIQRQWVYLLLSCILSLAVWTSLSPYYPTRYFAAFTLFLLASGFFCYRSAVLGVAFLSLGGIVFGNHPGGRFVEVYNLSLILSPIWIGLSRVQALTDVPRGRWFSLPFVGALAVLASFSGGFYLLEAFEGYKVEPYHFLSSRDWLPHYPMLVGLLTVSIVYSVWNSMRGSEVARRAGSVVLMIGPSIILVVALLEMLVPGVAEQLDKWHTRLGGYINRDYSHFELSRSLSPALNFSPNSLFWNRSWLSVYLVACLPVSGIALRLMPMGAAGKRILAGVFLFSLFLVQVAVGSRAGVVAVLLFFIVFFAFQLRCFRSRILLWGVATILALFTVSLPFLSFHPAGQLLGVRAELFRGGLELGKVFFLTGGGIESFGFWNDALLRGHGHHRIFSSSHNFFLQVLGGAGLMGVTAIAVLYWFSFRSLIMAISSQEAHGRSSMEPRLVFAGLIAVIFYGSFQEWWYIRVVQLNWWIAVLWPILLWPAKLPALPYLRAHKLKAMAAALGVAAAAMAAQAYVGLNLREYYLLFENVGHLEELREPLNSEETPDHNVRFRYPLLAGDGSYFIHSLDSIKRIDFECRIPPESLTGRPDPRIICQYVEMEEEQVLERPPE